MNTLCIHPKDDSTDFLKPIREGKGWQVYDKYTSDWAADYESKLRELYSLICEADRVVMMGHGSPNGLLGYGNLFLHPLVIKELSSKPTISIWCNADQYVEKHGLKGFYTGMFISELGEAHYERCPATEEEVNESNFVFADIYKDMTEEPDGSKLEYLKEEYRKRCGYSDVSIFNTERLYYR